MRTISKATVIRSPNQSQTAEFYTQERCYISELLNDAQEPALSVARARVEPGVQTQLHRLLVDERYIIEQGEGVLELGEAQTILVAAGDSALIPAGCAQRIKNTGECDLLFLCVCSPRFLSEHYDDLES